GGSVEQHASLSDLPGVHAHDAWVYRFIAKRLDRLRTTRRSLRVLGLRDAVARADIVQEEIAVRMNDLVAERPGHGGKVAPGMPAPGMERFDGRPRLRGRIGRMVTDRASELLGQWWRPWCRLIQKELLA